MGLSTLEQSGGLQVILTIGQQATRVPPAREAELKTYQVNNRNETETLE